MKRVVVDYTTAVEQAMFSKNKVFYTEVVREIPDSISALKELCNQGVMFLVEMEEIEEPEEMPKSFDAFEFTSDGVVLAEEEQDPEEDDITEAGIKLYNDLVDMNEKPRKKRVGREPTVDRQRVSELLGLGWSIKDISEELKCNKSVIYKIKKAMED